MTVDEVLEKLEQAKLRNDKRNLNLNVSIYLENKERGIGYIQDISGCDEDIASQVYDIKSEEYKKFSEEKAKLREEKEKYIPKCPTCGSPAVKKITGSKRWLTTGLFGLGSSNLGKTMECKNCGYKW